MQAKLGITLAPLVSIMPPIPGTVVKSVSHMIPGPDLGILTRKEGTGRNQLLALMKDEIRYVCGKYRQEQQHALLAAN